MGIPFPADMLKDQVAIVTGGATGIGNGIARRFVDLGATVVLASRKQENLNRAAAEITGLGGRALSVQTDVRDPGQVDRMVERAVDEFGRIDILVNNAAGNFICPAEELSVNGWLAVVNIVLNGTFFCTCAVGRDEGTGLRSYREHHGAICINGQSGHGAFSGGKGRGRGDGQDFGR